MSMKSKTQIIVVVFIGNRLKRHDLQQLLRGGFGDEVWFGSTVENTDLGVCSLGLALRERDEMRDRNVR